ncbi:nucleoside triphosphate pyrophosphohydrolase [Rubellimicrobium sp. CFH 75288]|uniref:nucleoside triphosphate pyrophosphohydrolase n=1 Tax=Rubellimicrobium sp. CFH 75288 TaxID=2697034 RepID=UPI00141372CB|nr:nucleoside triphosphate pyrophosphohydrolase [Rubellimicrobium sp. CFH 75288]NAZ36254.1 nucleoside triphosphate pyrophosphohydrolase [Rubellimicrobium sp. CFH 75288]
MPRDPRDETARLLDIMARLRDPDGGCPWDLEQTFATIAPYTIEEAYEVADAIAREDWDGLRGELGDLLLQAVYHARMAEEAGLFDFADVAAAVADKMVARHPHVFGEGAVRTAAEQTRAWEAQKALERGAGRVLDGVARALPALKRAEKLQARAARVGFDWPDAGPVLEKVAEEAREVAAAEGPDAREEEVGDLLFVLANLARHLGVDPEAALRRACDKFERRFAAVEDRLAERGRRPQDSTLAEMDALWDEVRRQDRAAGG